MRNWLDRAQPAPVVAAEMGSKAERLYAWSVRFPCPAARTAEGTLPRNLSNADLRSRLAAALNELRRVSEHRDI